MFPTQENLRCLLPAGGPYNPARENHLAVGFGTVQSAAYGLLSLFEGIPNQSELHKAFNRRPHSSDRTPTQVASASTAPARTIRANASGVGS